MCIIKVYLPPEKLDWSIAELRQAIAIAVKRVERSPIKDERDILWLFAKDQVSHNSRTGVLIEVSSFIGIRYMAGHTRKSLAEEIGSTLSCLGLARQHWIECLVDYPLADHGRWSSTFTK